MTLCSGEKRFYVLSICYTHFDWILVANAKQGYLLKLAALTFMFSENVYFSRYLWPRSVLALKWKSCELGHLDFFALKCKLCYVFPQYHPCLKYVFWCFLLLSKFTPILSFPQLRAPERNKKFPYLFVILRTRNFGDFYILHRFLLQID